MCSTISMWNKNLCFMSPTDDWNMGQKMSVCPSTMAWKHVSGHDDTLNCNWSASCFGCCNFGERGTGGKVGYQSQSAQGDKVQTSGPRGNWTKFSKPLPIALLTYSDICWYEVKLRNILVLAFPDFKWMKMNIGERIVIHTAWRQP